MIPPEMPPGPGWEAVLAAIRAGEDVENAVDRHLAEDRARFVGWLKQWAPEAAESYLAALRRVDRGIAGAEGVWAALSPAQRAAALFLHAGSGVLVRSGDGSTYAQECGHRPARAVRIRTLRTLAAHQAVAWDGGAFDPEARVVLTERGRFILTHGRGTP